MIEVPIIPAYSTTPGAEPSSSTTLTRNGVGGINPSVGELISNAADGTLFMEKTAGEPKEVGRAHARINSTGSHLKARRLNFIQGTNVTLSLALDTLDDELDLTINATGGGSVAWGAITGTLADQTDLNSALGGKAATGAVGSSGITMSTARLLGRNTAGTGAIEEITLGTNLSFSGTTLNAAGGSYDLLSDPEWIAKGNLVVGIGASAADILSVGANGRVLMANSVEPTGLEWVRLEASNIESSSGLVVVGRPSNSAGAMSEITFADGEVLRRSGTSLAAGKIESVNCVTNGIDFSAIQTVATNTILGRGSAGTGNIETLTCTSAARNLLDDATTTDMLTTLGSGATGRAVFAAATGQVAWDAVVTGWQSIASAATVDLSSSQVCVEITGTTSITQFTITIGEVRILRFTAACTITHDGVTITCMGNANITTAAGDVLLLIGTGTNRSRVCLYNRGASPPWAGSAFGNTFAASADSAAATAQLDVFTSGAKGLVSASGGGTTNFLRADGSWAAPPGGGGGDQAFSMVIEGDVAATDTTILKYWRAPTAGTINRVTCLSDANATCTWVIRKCAYADYPGSLASIVASAKPTLSAARKSEDTTLTGWTTAFSAGDVFELEWEGNTAGTPGSITLDVRYTPS